MKFLFPAIFLALMLNSCKILTPTPEVSNTPTEVKETEEPTSDKGYFIIGEGGGFTGLYTQYKVSENGKVELYNEEDESFTLKGKLASATAKEIFTQMRVLKLNEYEYYKPGNLNYRIKIPGEPRTNLITWSDSNSPDEEVLVFYKKVMNEISNLD